MAGFTDYLEDALLKHVFTNTSYTSPSAVYAALYTVAPSDTGGGTEVSTSGTAYARQAMAFSVSGTGTLATNSAAVEYPTATADYGTVVAVGIFDASSSGNLLAYASLTANKTVSSGDVFRFNAGDVDITLT
jgi:hypothetical protein|tara:strand:+ start:596 stop:991 length:396 start_codon:yes stop_codon:yes gene_type:complete